MMGSPRERRFRRRLRTFRQAMRHEFRCNAHKGDWTDDSGYLHAFETLYHAAKLALAVQAKDRAAVLEYAADVANHALMTADTMDALDTGLLTPGPLEYGDEPPAWARALPDVKREVREHHRDVLAVARAAVKAAA